MKYESYKLINGGIRGMKVYKDNSKTEVVAEIPEQSIIALLEWEHAEYDKANSFLSIPIRSDLQNFGTDFNTISSDQIELCIHVDKMETVLYINNGEEDGTWEVWN